MILASAPLNILSTADMKRTNSASEIGAIRALGVHVIMLSGDNEHTAAAIAAQAGVTGVRGNLLPEDKLAAIQTLRAVWTGWHGR
ncbi:HAD family hydrolase [Undibacterium sp. Jales W-56]|nr:HAD family hydrolase [Undibacterium sp. Jales W-56]MCU6435293.1 HAD family hydrolase [Undibacterium sp. Jales W-56]